MPVWRVDIYDNRDDPTPSEKGFVRAPSEDDAARVVGGSMGNALRADLTRMVVPNEGKIEMNKLHKL